MKRLFAQFTKNINLISNQCLATQKERTKNLLRPNDEHSKRFYSEEKEWKKSYKT